MTSDLEPMGWTYTNQDPPEMLGRSTCEEITLPLLGCSLQCVSDDFGVEDGDFGIEWCGFESGDDSLSLCKLSVRDEPSRS